MQASKRARERETNRPNDLEMDRARNRDQ